MRVCPQRHSKRPRKPKISQLQVSFSIDEQILRLQISMDNPMAMTVSGALDQLRHEFFDHVLAESETLHVDSGAFWKCFASTTITHWKCFHVFLQIQVQKLEDEVQLVAIGMDNVKQPHNIGIIHFLE